MGRAMIGVAVVLLAGCTGGDQGGGSTGSGAGSCDFSACGGDPVGRWELEDACIKDLASAFEIDQPACEGIVRDIMVDSTGTLEVRADGTASQAGNLSLQLEMTLTPACFSASSGGETLTAEVCSSLQDQYESQPDFASATCSFAAAGCGCTIVSAPRRVEGMETFEVQGNQLVTNSGTRDFCVDGDVLSIRATLDGEAGVETYRRAP